MLKHITLIAIAGLWMGAANADHRQYEMRVDGLTCPFCIATSSKALKRIDGVYEVSVDLDQAVVSVCADAATDLGDETMARLFRSKGYTYRSQTVSEGCTITDIAHSAAGEDLTEHTHAHSIEDAADHDDGADDSNHTEHAGHGS